MSSSIRDYKKEKVAFLSPQNLKNHTTGEEEASEEEEDDEEEEEDDDGDDDEEVTSDESDDSEEEVDVQLPRMQRSSEKPRRWDKPTICY